MEDTTDIKPPEDSPSGPTACYPPVLDACCGGRMMWFDKANPMALFQDKRREVVRAWNYDREMEVDPDVLGDFTKMEFPDDTFHLVVFDPPHFDSLGENSRTAQMYGRLFGDWDCEIGAGFRECFRVLKPFGTLIFKWNSYDIPLARILELAPVPPLFGHTTGRQALTHWVTFMKPAVGG